MKNTSEENHRILVIDDTESIHADFRKTLGRESSSASIDRDEEAIFGTPSTTDTGRIKFEIDSASQGQEGHAKVKKAAMEGHPYAVAFVDMRMPPGWDGVKTIENLWRDDPALQVVICTAYSDYSWDQIVQRLGVNDKLLILKKPFDTPEVCQLAMALTQKWEMTRKAMMRVNELESLVSERTADLRHVALHDKLTGLANRAAITERLRQTLGNEAGRANFALIFMDFDRFKIVNDSLGHEAGDALLIEIAKRCQQTIDRHTAPGVTINPGRLGGDEFVILVEASDAQTRAVALSNDLLVSFREPYNIKGHHVYSTASIGIAPGRPDYTLPEEILRDADAAMYHAKSSGKDRFTLFDPSMHSHTLKRLELETDLRAALERRELELHYQPIITVDSGAIEGFEALVRWRSPKRGLIPSNDFIPLAEETGLIIPLGAFVFEEALRQLHDWADRFPAAPPIYMSINLSKRQLIESDLVSMIARLLKSTGADPSRVKIEITESTIMERGPSITSVLNQLRELGVSLAMDDFGTGHSSLTCLQRFPIQTVKIDRAFIMDLESNIKFSAVIQAVVVLAKNLGMRVVAEGIETPGQLAQIQSLDCDAAQGYLFAKPQPAAGCEAMLSSGVALAQK